MTTQNTPMQATSLPNELDLILAKHNGELGVTWEDPDVVTPDTKAALLSWHNQQLGLRELEGRQYALEQFLIDEGWPPDTRLGLVQICSNPTHRRVADRLFEIYDRIEQLSKSKEKEV